MSDDPDDALPPCLPGCHVETRTRHDDGCPNEGLGSVVRIVPAWQAFPHSLAEWQASTS